MKNKFLIIFFILSLNCTIAFSENILIESKNISIEKKREVTIFKEDVIVKTEDEYEIKSQYGEYNKKTGTLVLKDKIKAKDEKNNIVETNFAEYNEFTKIFKTIGLTRIITSEKYKIEGEDIIVNNKEKIISSAKKALITDKDNNQIYLDKFEYKINENIFKSIGYVKVQDKFDNSYEFSQIYIDTKKKEILGTDSKLFINQKILKLMKEINQEYLQILLRLVRTKVFLRKVFLHYVVIEKMINVLHGLFNLAKCFMTIKRKQFFMIMLLSKFMTFQYFTFQDYLTQIPR